ncbi:ribonuclease M5 [Levilactobacillus namurensis DSM 19117]|uniref:Ribonuclease M5 n=2 Tax=Levilactobacillus namurensis TaxID=380393 RepID=A0A0R1JXG5_9LACO|nr:ribonuclease M5 [Levilactobacillus namurensis]PTM21608.1 ribonuclease M5 [Lactobacillus sp. PFC-70]KRK75934.1 ribonuclease M5 [Levilactobacillus namurensis DSM 19117]MDT7012906.1 ribonuclease M5 [Levilactobacillus namurensis]GEO74490.1 ribonuclease M5 [Levilactobacillus namurensis]HJE45880.1 ribonuclease M5 [Levilactobacillus namurensis]
MKKIKEVLVVEGKDDTKAINRAVNADTIETRGSAIDDDTLALIEKLADQRGIIIFTDPDFSGEKIRKIVAEAVPNAKHAFLPKKEGRPDKAGGSLGVEHATPEAIRAALAHVYTETEAAPELISHADLVTAGLIGGAGAKQRREQLGELLQIGYVNGKQLEKRLRMFGIQPAEFGAALAKLPPLKEDLHAE